MKHGDGSVASSLRNRLTINRILVSNKAPSYYLGLLLSTVEMGFGFMIFPLGVWGSFPHAFNLVGYIIFFYKK
ncbi:hypothetical protein B0G93_101466 [Bacillus sp. V-88]|nr:hypothetical protein B1B00_02200 [Bacillus sp. DSM 27956]PRX79716.1 hypothetical protein B0G93_101466 [Bacillus sp. V-88]SLK02076.1 hypothetical protein SAMN06295884_101466 [Bacillus sp. V-88]